MLLKLFISFVLFFYLLGGGVAASFNSYFGSWYKFPHQENLLSETNSLKFIICILSILRMISPNSLEEEGDISIPSYLSLNIAEFKKAISVIMSSVKNIICHFTLIKIKTIAKNLAPSDVNRQISHSNCTSRQN